MSIPPSSYGPTWGDGEAANRYTTDGRPAAGLTGTLAPPPSPGTGQGGTGTPAAAEPPAGTPPRTPPPEPEPAAAREANAVPRRVRPITRRRGESFVMYSLLTIMALADAAGFWIALSELVQADAALLLIVVAALSIGTVAVAHHAGNLVRSRRESCGGSVVWIAILVALWLGLGAVAFWIRAVTPPLGAAPDTRTQLQVAVLFLGIYLLTGALAMTHAYRVGDPVTAELRAARDQRRRQIAEVAMLEYESRQARGELTVQQEDIGREEKQHEREQGLGEAESEALRREGQLTIAAPLASPSATDGLTNPESGLGEDPEADIEEEEEEE